VFSSQTKTFPWKGHGTGDPSPTAVRDGGSVLYGARDRGPVPYGAIRTCTEHRRADCPRYIRCSLRKTPKAGTIYVPAL
jgi:hypothetical protein